ncbi:hypothetical protein SLA2020_285980 [Shorea laevis]
MEGLPPGYRPNVGICLINSESQIFVASRLNVPGAWQMPQGVLKMVKSPNLQPLENCAKKLELCLLKLLPRFQIG